MPSELDFTLLGFFHFVHKGELPLPLAYGLLSIQIGIAIGIILSFRAVRSFKVRALRQLMPYVRNAASQIQKLWSK